MTELAANGPQPEPKGTQSFLLALAVHLAFFAFLMFAVSWRTEPPQGMVAELWTSLPAAPQPAPPAPAPEPEAKPEPPKPAPPPPEPKPEPKPEPRPDIVLKEKQEQEKKKRAEEERKKQEAEKRRLEQQKAAEAERVRREQAKQQEQQEQLARLAREQESLNRQLQAQQAAGQARLVDDYRGRIVAKIKRFIVMPPEVPGNPEAQFEVVLLPSGEVLSAKLRKSSGHPAYDQAVERAILKAQPLPLPPDPALFANFRNLELKFRPVE